MSRRRRVLHRLRRWAPFAGFYIVGYHLGRGEGVLEGRRQVGEALASREAYRVG